MQDPLKEIRESVAALTQAWIRPTGEPITRDQLARLGKMLWPLSYQEAPSDDEAFTRLASVCQRMVTETPPDSLEWLFANSFLYLPDQQITGFAVARWVDQGLPTLQLTHKYAAALMASSVEKTDLSEVPVPWKAFVIDPPAGMLAIEDPESGALSDIRHILVHHMIRDGEPIWTYMAYTSGRVSLWQHGVPMGEIVNDGLDGEVDWSTYSFGLKTDDRDARMHLLIGRLIVGVCLALSGKDRPLKPVGAGHKYKGDLRTAAEPLQRIFQLGHPITMDCREALSDYIEGRTKKLVSVQSLVVGHWKRQPHGPQNSLRKWIWREPFWRGPEDGPILDRPHKMGS